MQFDQAVNRGDGWSVMQDAIRVKMGRVARRLGWTNAGPTPLVYWNLRNTRGHPVTKDTAGTVFVGGFFTFVVAHGHEWRRLGGYRSGGG